jgi:hypothetical protein
MLCDVADIFAPVHRDPAARCLCVLDQPFKPPVKQYRIRLLKPKKVVFPCQVAIVLRDKDKSFPVRSLDNFKVLYLLVELPDPAIKRLMLKAVLWVAVAHFFIHFDQLLYPFDVKHVPLEQ